MGTNVRRALGLPVGVLLLLAACGSDSDEPARADSSQPGGLSGEIEFVSIRNLTGPIGPPDTRILEGQQFAVDEINASGMLGDATISLETIDVASDVQQAVNATTGAVTSDAVVAFSPVFSSQVLGMAPIAQRGSLPFVVVSAGVPGILEAGDFVFRITPPQSTFIGHTVVECLADAGVERVALVYADANATTALLGEQDFPAEFDQLGIESTGEGYPQGTTDFSAVVTRLLASNPDAVGLMALNAEIPPLIAQLERQGYTGRLFSHAAVAAVDLEPVTAEAEGMVWAAAFSADGSAPSTQEFTANWIEANGSPPDTFHAEGYDSVYLAARAVQRAGSVDREAIQAAMKEVAAEGFDGALGSLSFEDRDARSDGVLLEWIDGEIALSDGCD